MTDELDDIIAANSSGIVLPTQARRQVIPYEDLSSLSPPVDLPQVGHDMIPTLAILVAQGVQKPQLLTIDANGGLRVNARLQVVTKLTAALPALATVAMVQDTSGFYVGDRVTLISAANTSNVCTEVVVQSVDSPTQLTFKATCSGQNFVVGDYVIGEQVSNIRDIFNPVSIGGTLIQTAIGAPGTFDTSVMNTTTVKGHRRFATDPIRSLDGSVRSGPVFNAKCSVTVPSFGVGFRGVIKWIRATIFANGGAVAAETLRVFRGNAATGTLIHDEPSTGLAAGNTDRIVIQEPYWKSDDNSILTVDWDIFQANSQLYINVGYYVEG